MSEVNLPNIREPFIDPRSGQISRPWWIWLQQLMTRIGGSAGTDISALTALVTALIATAMEHGNEINGQVALPPQDPEEGFDPAQVGAIPFDYVSEANTSAPVQSVFGRIGAVTAQAGDYAVGQVTNAASVLNPLSQFAATTSAQLAGVMSDETGSGALVFGTTPTITNPNIVGTNTNDNAAAGSVGEFVSSTVLVGSAVSLTSGVTANVTSISLTAGDWDVEGNVAFASGGSTITNYEIGAISTTSATLPTAPYGGGGFTLSTPNYAGGGSNIIPTGRMRLSLASTTTVYLVTNASFGTSTLAAYGFIGARRVR